MGRKREIIHRSWTSLTEVYNRRADWKSYKDAYEDDAELKSFDADLQSRATKVISTLQSGDVSTDFMDYVTDFKQKTLDAILLSRDDISSNSESKMKKKMECFEVVVEEYRNNCKEMLDFCSVLNSFLESSHSDHSKIAQVIQQYEVDTETEDSTGGNKYSKILKELKSLNATADCRYHSADDLLQKFQSMQAKHQELLNKLNLENENLVKEKKSARALRKAVNMIFITTVVAECVIAAALVGSAPPAALAIVPTIGATIAANHWALALLTQNETGLLNNLNILYTMQDASTPVFAKKELDDVKLLIDNVAKDIGSISPNPAIEGQVETAIKNIKTKLDMFLKKIDDLMIKGENCSSEISKSKVKVERSMELA